MKMYTKTYDSVTDSAHFKEHGFAIMDTPSMPTQVMESFNNMPRDGHSIKRLREIRLSQYFGYWEENLWIFALLPKRNYIQSAEYIRIAEAGGVMRYREQLECDPSSLISAVLNTLPIDKKENYHINVNQIRVIANMDFKGITVPEGPHRDGHEFSVIVVANRYNVIGGETQIIDPNTLEIVHRVTLQDGQAILIDDERYIHYATDIAPEKGEVGHRDIWVIEIDHWHNRTYGPAHERRASSAKLSLIEVVAT